MQIRFVSKQCSRYVNVCHTDLGVDWYQPQWITYGGFFFAVAVPLVVESFGGYYYSDGVCIVNVPPVGWEHLPG